MFVGFIEPPAIGTDYFPYKIHGYSTRKIPVIMIAKYKKISPVYLKALSTM
jgi:hypothetical protein